MLLYSNVLNCTLIYIPLCYSTVMYTDVNTYVCNVILYTNTVCSTPSREKRFAIYSNVHYSTLLYSNIQGYTVMYSTVHYCTVTYRDIQYCTVQ